MVIGVLPVIVIVIFIVIVLLLLLSECISLSFLFSICLMILKCEIFNSHLKWIARSMKVMPLSSNSGVSI